ncbi:MAG: glycosyltransferase [Candidatus Aminicenantia bacterium]
MKIFVTVGFDRHPIDRLVRAIDKGVEDHTIPGETFIQTGYSQYFPRFCESRNFLEFDEIIKFVERSEIIVSHAGVGTTLLCLSLGKIPILFPRQSKFAEHVDNHQVDFAKKMEEQGKALVAYDEKDLIFKISHYKSLVCSLSIGPVYNEDNRLRMHLKRLLSI